jgi:nickel-type superoxide dismutase maturation protease
VRWPIWRVAVAERSMEPTLRPGDWLLVWRGPRSRRSAVKPGHVVIARHPGDQELLLVKRAARLESAGWWLTSDNNGVGEVDSRTFGPLPPELIEGRVLARYWPLPRVMSGAPAAGRAPR